MPSNSYLIKKDLKKRFPDASSPELNRMAREQERNLREINRMGSKREEFDPITGKKLYKATKYDRRNLRDNINDTFGRGTFDKYIK